MNRFTVGEESTESEGNGKQLPISHTIDVQEEMTPTARQKIRDGFKVRFGECVTRKGSVYALSKAANVPTPTLRRYLNGSEPSLTILVAIAEAANVSVEWLATGDGPMSKKAWALRADSNDPKFKAAVKNLFEAASKVQVFQ